MYYQPFASHWSIFREEHPGPDILKPFGGLRREVRHLLESDVSPTAEGFSGNGGTPNQDKEVPWNQEIRSFVTCWRVWETTFTKGKVVHHLLPKNNPTQWKNLKSQKFLGFDEISENLDPIWVESISPLSRIHMDVSENSATSKWMVYNGKPN